MLRPQVVAKVVEIPKIEVQELVIKVQKIAQYNIDTVMHNPRIRVEVEKPKLAQEALLQEGIAQVPKVVEQVIEVPRVFDVPVDVP